MSKSKEKEIKEKKAKAAEAPEAETAAENDIPEAEVITPDSGNDTADPKDDEIAKLKDQLMRNMAEYDNYRKRTQREKTEMMPELTARIVGEFLPVLDNLERALAADCSDEGYKTGVQMIYDSFMAALEKLGVEKVETETFDPSMHQAVQQVQSDTLESGMIATVFQNGYRIGAKVLRFAMVAVAQ